MPKPLARPRVQRNQAIGEQVIPQVPYANEVWLRATRGNVGNTAHVIQRHPLQQFARILFRAVPGFIAKFPRVRHGVKSPQQFAA